MRMGDGRPNILYLVHRVPYPPNRGDRIRSFHLLEFLAGRSRVHLAFLCQQAPARETMRVLRQRCAGLAAVVLGDRMRWVRAAWSLVSGRTATEGLFCAPRMRRIVRRWAAEQRFDAAIVFCSSMVQYLKVPGLEGVPAVVDLVDVDSQKWFDYAEGSRGLKRLLFRLEGRRLRRLEASLSQRAAAVTLVSRHEADLFRDFCPADCVHAIPNGVDLEYFRPAAPAESAASQRCVFVGALDYRANIDGVRWFCEQVWPEVHRRRPDATFAVVGSNPAAAARRLAELPGVELVGEVPDVRPHLAGAAVAVVPLRVARGIQNKVLEALAMGKAVVATPQALEGLGVEPDVHVCRAADAGEWVEAVTGLLEDAQKRARLGSAGRAYVEAHHRWDVQLRPFADLLGLAETPPSCSQAGGGLGGTSRA